MLGEDFELEFADGTLWIEADSGEELWELFSTSSPPVMVLADRLDARARRGVPPRVRRALRGLPRGRRHPRAAAVPARPREAALSGEVTGLLQELIRLDTVNPPGNETTAADLLRAYLEAAGVECETYAKVPERANLVGRFRGTGDGPTLLFLSHTDTVLADPAEWQHDPVRATCATASVWGRGALDMKGQVAASAVAIASLAREGFRPAGDLVFAAAPTRRSATASACSGSSRRTPRRCAPTTRSTRAPATAWSSAAASSTSARRPRR